MSHTVFLGNLPAWVTADDIKSWLMAENLMADQIKVIRNPETQESKGFAFIEAPNQEEMQSIIRRFDRAPLEDRLLRANPAQPPRGRRPMGAPGAPGQDREQRPAGPAAGAAAPAGDRRRMARPRTGDAPPPRTERADRAPKGKAKSGPPSAFAEELAKAL
ncbi:MAG TPA: RNA-binding protein [Bryobacteraceae bacterium]|nr:RNA-binding protein [Bryobacteraceae bacterium]